MKASDAVALFLARHEIQYCFELIGGMITHLIDSFDKEGSIKIVSMHHEQAAAFAAEGVARYNCGEGLAIAMGTSGPGATNLLTGISSCWCDSIPCLFITGQVNCSELKQDRLVRQQGFQELDIISMAKPVTKFAVQVEDVSQLLPLLHEAMSTARSGRKGPVLLDIPNDIQRVDIPDDQVQQWLDKPLSIQQGRAATDADIEALKTFCADATRPLVCFGGGAAATKQQLSWVHQLEAQAIPYVSTLMGQRAIPDADGYQHMIGTYGNREANWALQHCDLLLVLGARLDVRQTGADLDDFARSAKIVQIDIDPAQLDNRVTADLSICCDLNSLCGDDLWANPLFPLQDESWFDELAAVKRRSDFDEYSHWKISPSRLMRTLSESLSEQPVHYVCDIGNHQMWAAQSLRLSEGQTIHHDGGLGAMGFSLPAAIGIALASRQKTVVITGDGGFQINLQELDTIRRLKLDITILILNNASLGMVKNFQDMYFDGRDRSTFKGYSHPSFTRVAEAFEIQAIKVTSFEEWLDIQDSISEIHTPLLVDVVMEGATECRPRLTFGDRLDSQYPPVEVEKKL